MYALRLKLRQIRLRELQFFAHKSKIYTNEAKMNENEIICAK